VTATNSIPNESSVLCTIDFSRSSREALQWAIQLAKQLNAHITILYTYRLIQYRTGEAIQLKRDIEASANFQFGLLEKEMLEGCGITYDFKVEIGFTADRIEDYAKKNVLNFLVTNKNIHNDGRESFDALIDNIRVPLLVVP
jgi:nucleotide-binding universal stress UspA family protein